MLNSGEWLNNNQPRFANESREWDISRTAYAHVALAGLKNVRHLTSTHVHINGCFDRTELVAYARNK